MFLTGEYSSLAAVLSRIALSPQPEPRSTICGCDASCDGAYHGSLIFSDPCSLEHHAMQWCSHGVIVVLSAEVVPPFWWCSYTSISWLEITCDIRDGRKQ